MICRGLCACNEMWCMCVLYVSFGSKVRPRTLWNASFKLTLFGCVISICCVGFASLDVVCDELNDCAWNVCR